MSLTGVDKHHHHFSIEYNKYPHPRQRLNKALLHVLILMLRSTKMKTFGGIN